MQFKGREFQFWGSIATGCLLGLIVLLILPLVQTNYFKSDKNFLPYHWQNTSLNSQQVAKVINDDNCYQSQRTQLACISAIVHMALRNHLELTQSGDLVAQDDSNMKFKIDLSEKDKLQAWQMHLKQKSLSLSFNSLLEKVVQISEKNEKQSIQQIFSAGLNAYFSIAKDPHTYLIPLSYFSDVVMNSTPRQKNYGFTIGVQNEKIYIKKVTPNSPAQLSGLRPGDQILTISKRRIIELASFELAEVMLEGLQKDLELEIRRGDIVLSVRLTPSTTELPAVTSEIYGENKRLGVIQINKFSSGVCRLVSDEVVKLKHQLVRGVMLDLRDNSGGVIDEAGCILSLFIGPDKEAFSIRFFANPGRKEVVTTNKNQIYTGPLMVLINSNSASASELLAGSLKHYQRAQIAGEASYGKGSFQEGKAWEGNDKILIFETKGFYFLPNGETPQYIGVIPDIEIKQMRGLGKREKESFLFPLLNPNEDMNHWSDKEPAQGLVKSQNSEQKPCLSLDQYQSKAQSEDQSLVEGLKVLSCLKTSYAIRRSN